MSEADKPGLRAVREYYSVAARGYLDSATHASDDDLQKVLARCDPAPHETALDIATGGGHTARTLAPFVHRVLMLDLTPALLGMAYRALADDGIAHVRPICADAHCLPIADDSIDIVTCRIAPHHFHDPLAFCREVGRVLAPRGRLVLEDTVEPEDETIDVWHNEVERLRDPSHRRNLRLGEWRDLVLRAGLYWRSHEIHAKTHDLQDWIERSRQPAAVQEEVWARFSQAPAKVRSWLDLPLDTSPARTFTDRKLIFTASCARRKG